MRGQALVLREFQRLEETREILGLTECRMLVRQGPPRTRYRVPGICLIEPPLEERGGPLTKTVPLIVVEVLSGEEAMSDVLANVSSISAQRSAYLDCRSARPCDGVQGHDS